MKLEPEMTLEQFREEMQYRVVKFPLRSLAVREALRFARKHENPEFYRAAANKVHAQRQFQRELYGPSRWERTFDYFSLGSLREVVVTLVLVVGGIAGIEATKRYFSREPLPPQVERMDVEQLARRLGLAMDAASQAPSPSSVPPKATAPTPNSGAAAANSPSADRLHEDDIRRIVQAVLHELKGDAAPPTGEADAGDAAGSDKKPDGKIEQVAASRQPPE